MTSLGKLWARLRQVRALSFVAQSAAQTGWNGAGSGTVVVQAFGDQVLTFTEAGVWRPEGGSDIRFRNVFRWTLAGSVVRLEHLRFGAENPVYLFDLEAAGEREWRSASPHLCRKDCYAAHLVVHDDHILVRWFVDGPRKQELIEYRYNW
jgi:hypothetical protein